MTGLAPNLLAVELVKKTAKIELEWFDWFVAAAPAGILLLVFVPLLAYWLYPPEVKEGAEVSEWAGKELDKMGGITGKEITLGGAGSPRPGDVDLSRGRSERYHSGADHNLPDARDEHRHLG